MFDPWFRRGPNSPNHYVKTYVSRAHQRRYGTPGISVKEFPPASTGMDGHDLNREGTTTQVGFLRDPTFPRPYRTASHFWQGEDDWRCDLYIPLRNAEEHIPLFSTPPLQGSNPSTRTVTVSDAVGDACSIDQGISRSLSVMRAVRLISPPSEAAA